MSIFSWLFSKDTEKNSQVSKWVTEEVGQVDDANPDVYAIFVRLMHVASQCAKYSIDGENKQFYQISKQYLGDATIFEIACYSYFRLEEWLTANSPELKKEITVQIRKWLIEKFSLTFYLTQQQVDHLFAELLNHYQTIMEANQQVENVQCELAQRILMSKGDKFNKQHLTKETSSMNLDLEYIKNRLMHYEEVYIPKISELVQVYCKQNAKLQTSKTQYKELNTDEKDYLYGMALVAQEDWVRACKALTKAIATNPKHYDALVQRGILYITMHQSVNALQDFTVAIELKPSEPVAYLYRAKCYHRNFRQKDKSLADYSVAIDLAPNYVEGYLGRGQLYDDIALRDEKQASEKNDHEKVARVSDEFLAAINDYNKVIAIEPKHDIAHVNRALIYARKARANKNIDFAKNAIADFEQAINLNWEHGYLYKQQDEMKALIKQEN